MVAEALGTLDSPSQEGGAARIKEHCGQSPGESPGLSRKGRGAGKKSPGRRASGLWCEGHGG